jgi:hypothetical protein
MSITPRVFFLSAALATIALLPLPSALAQMPGSPSGVSSALIQLFGANTNFTAKAKMEVLGREKKLLLSGPMDVAMRDGSFRMELDLSQAGGSDAPAGSAMLKQMGMEKLTSIIRMDKREVHVVLPILEGVLTTPFSKEEVQALANPPKVTEKELGKETLGGVAVVKKQLSTTIGTEQRVATVWVAPSLSGFPLQIETTEGANTLVLKFSDVKLTKPAAALFETPKGYTLYKSVEEMTQGAMEKMLKSGGATPGR